MTALAQRRPAADAAADESLPPAAVADHPTLERIDGLPVSEHWKATFRAILSAGGPGLPHARDLRWRVRWRARRPNLAALLLGPCYYAALGMWKKGLALSAVALPVLLMTSALAATLGAAGLWAPALVGLAAVFGLRANVDYYRTMVLGDTGWW